MKSKSVYPFYLVPLMVPMGVWANTASVHQEGDTYILYPQNEPEQRFDVTREVQLQSSTLSESVTSQQNHEKRLQLSSEELLKQPNLLHHALVSAVTLKDIEGVKILLPLYLSLPAEQQQDTLLIQVSQGMVAYAEGEAAKAAEHYEAALQQKPDMPSVRMNFARALFDDHQNLEADNQFEIVKQEEHLKKEIIDWVGAYQAALKKRSEWDIYAGANYTRDNNINNTPKQRVYQIGRGKLELPKPESAQGIAYRAGAEKDWNLWKNYRVRSGVDLNGKYYWDNSRYDDFNIRAYTGVAYRNQRAEAALLPYYDRRWYGGSRYSVETGVRTEGSYWIKSDKQVLFGGEIGKERYDRRSFLDGLTANTSATFLWVQSPKQYFTFGVDLSRKRANDHSDAYHRKGARLSWKRAWGKGFQTVLSASVGRRKYDVADFFNIVRKDNEYNTVLTVWNDKMQLWGITPRLVGVYQKNKSNHFMYNYHKAYAFIQLNKSI